MNRRQLLTAGAAALTSLTSLAARHGIAAEKPRPLVFAHRGYGNHAPMPSVTDTVHFVVKK